MKMVTIKQLGSFLLLASLLVGLALSAQPGVQVAQAAEGGEMAEETALSAPQRVETLSAGWQHTCGLKSDGTLACWGYD